MNQAITPYPEPGGETMTSGHSGTDTSKDRAVSRDASGKTATVQTKLMRYLAAAGYRGATIKDVREVEPKEHHGTLSGALTQLHLAGKIQRLTEVRDRCTVYVGLGYADGRETIDPPKKIEREVVEIPAYAQGYQDIVEIIGRPVFAALQAGADEVVVRWAK